MSHEYVPNNWVIFKVIDGYKVLAGWSGSYLTGSSWRLSSGIADIEDHGSYWKVIQYSGSIYYCNKNRNGISIAMMDMYQQLIDLGGSIVAMEDAISDIKKSVES